MNFKDWTTDNILEIIIYYSNENHILLQNFINWYDNNFFIIQSQREFYSVKSLKKLLLKMDELIKNKKKEENEFKEKNKRENSIDETNDFCIINKNNLEKINNKNREIIINNEEYIDDEPEYEKEEIIYEFTFDEFNELEQILIDDINDYSYHNYIITKYRQSSNYYVDIIILLSTVLFIEIFL